MELVHPFSKIEPVSIFFKTPQNLIEALLSLPNGIARSEWPPTTTTTTTTTTTPLFQETFSDEFAKMIDVSKSTDGFVCLETFDPENIFVEMHYRILKKKMTLLENLRCLMPTATDVEVEAQLHTILMDGVTEVSIMHFKLLLLFIIEFIILIVCLFVYCLNFLIFKYFFPDGFSTSRIHGGFCKRERKPLAVKY
jgi:hypothetical protein